MSIESKFGKCVNCDTEMIPIWFKEDEYIINNGRRIKSGRTRTACSHLECPICLNKECVDDTFDMPWSR